MNYLLKHLFIPVFALMQLPAFSQAYQQGFEDFEQPFIVAADSIIKQGASISATDATSQLTNNQAPVSVSLTRKNKKKLHANQIYERASAATVIISGACLCSKCSHTHINPATGYFISQDGVCVTNYHVVESYCHPGDNMKPLAFVVRLRDGRTFPVKKVLTSSGQNDLAVLLIDTHGEKVPSLALATEANVGDNVFIVSHPQKMFYTFSEGMVTLKFRDKVPAPNGNGYMERNFMAVSAGFATGSSGAAVLDRYGNVTGTVYATRTLVHEGLEGKPVQMVVKSTIPVSALKELVQPF